MAVYNPSKQLPITKPFGATGNFPVDGKYNYYYDGDSGLYVYRSFISVEEIGTYMGSTFRRKGDTFLVNTGGTLNTSTGVITGGTNSEYWYKDDTTTPVAKGGSGGGTQGYAFGDYVGRIAGGGIGIGSARCTIYSNADDDIILSANSTFSAATGGVRLQTHSLDRLTIDDNGNVTIKILETDGTAPTTTGTLNNVVVDANGRLSRQVGGSGTIPETSGGTPTGNFWEISVEV